MEKFTVYDAFKTFELEDEEIEKQEALSKKFDLNNKKDVEEAAEFIIVDDDIDNSEVIVDVDATDKEELKPSYVGDFVLQCPVCNSLVSKEEKDIIRSEDRDSEENDLVNVGEECAICHNNSGFVVVGKIAKVEEPDDLEKDDDTLLVANDIKEVEHSGVDKFDIEDSFSEIEDEALEEDTVKQNGKWVNKGKDGTHGTFKTKKAADAQRKAMFASGYRAEGITEVLGDLSEEEIDDKIRQLKQLYETEPNDLTQSELDFLIQSGALTESLPQEYFDAITRYVKVLENFLMKHGVSEEEIKELEKNKGLVFTGLVDKLKELGLEDEFEVEIGTMTEGLTKAQKHNKNLDRIFTAYHKQINAMKDFLLKNGVSEEEVIELEKNTGLHGNALQNKIIELGLKDKFWEEFNKLTEAPILEPEYDARKSFYGKAFIEQTPTGPELYSYGTRVAKIEDGKVVLFRLWNSSQTTLRHVKEFLRQYGFKADTQKQIEKDYLKECLNVVVSSEGDAVKVGTENKEVSVEETTTGEVEVKVKDKPIETKASVGEIDTTTDIDTTDKEIVDTEEKEITIDESKVEPLVNKFLIETYENVNSFKVTNYSSKGNNVMIEGVINFKSKNTTPTKFILECKPFTKLAKYRLCGMNETFSKSKKAFMFTGKLDENKKFDCEAFTYCYRVKTLNEGVSETKKVSGRITLK